MRAGLMLVLLWPLLPAQTITSPDRIIQSQALSGKPLECSVSPLRPALGFNFRIQAGYIVHLPLNQFSGPGHSVTALLRITPDVSGASPVFLTDSLRLPPVPPNDLTGEFGGGFYMGAGRYHVNWLLVDETGRACVKEWRIESELPHDTRINPGMAPGTIAELSLRLAPSANRHPDAVPPLRLTVLLDAAPLSAGNFTETELRSADRIFLLGALSALLERLPTSAVRLVVFNLAQQRELLRRDSFSRDWLGEVIQTLNQLQLAKVDYSIAQSRTGHLDLLARLINQELCSASPSDAVVILGPRERYHDKLPPGALATAGDGAPKFFFLAHGLPRPLSESNAAAGSGAGGGRGGRFGPLSPVPLTQSGDMAGPQPGDGSYDMHGAIRSDVPTSSGSLPDSVTLAVRSLRGEIFDIKSPADFVKAVHEIERVTRR